MNASGLRLESPTTTADVVSLVREAADARRGLRIAGAMTWLDAGHPARVESCVSLRGIAGITSYTPEDLTLSCGAGTTLAELDAATRAHGQWCPLLPWGSDAGTVGATVATATTGPFAATFGRPRNLVLGLECVDGTGRVINAGGRVVKNVAGFDLTRLMTGAWGTLGVITQVHLRLRARPVVDETWSLTVPRADAATVDAFADGPLAPLACVRLHADQQACRPHEACWLVRIGGNRAFVNAARSALMKCGPALERDETSWTAVRMSHAPAAATSEWRWDALSLRLRERFDPAHVLNPGLLGEAA